MSNITKAIAALGVVAGLGVASLPLSSYAATDDTHTATAVVPVTVTIDDTISISTDKATVDFGTIMPGAEAKTVPLAVTVLTNVKGTYSLTAIANNDGQLVSDTLTSGRNSVIAPIASDAALGNGTKSVWGISPAGGANWQGLDKEVTFKSSTAIDGSTDDASDVTNVLFGISTVDGQAAGTYTAEVTFTATVTED